MNNFHTPVLLEKVKSFSRLVIQEGKPLRAFDGTFGGGGYSLSLLQDGFQVFATDLDESAIEMAKKNPNFSPYFDGRLSLDLNNFSYRIAEFADNYFDFITLDLGYSNNQLISSSRGFSYKNDHEEFDLRYDSSQGLKAWELIKYNDVKTISKIIFNNSGENLAHKIALSLKKIAVDKAEYMTVEMIKKAVLESIPRIYKKKKESVLSRVWQAFRIEVNQEFSHLSNFLTLATQKLNTKGVMAIVAFHSLEDKIVANYFRKLAQPVEIDDFGNKRRDFILLTKKQTTPDDSEVVSNTQSRSAILRAIQKQ